MLPTFRVAVAAALLSTMLVAVPATAQAADDACPAGRVPATAFTDTVRSTHRASIDCAAWWAITSGRSASTFGPDDRITRGQTAAMIARLLREAGITDDNAASDGTPTAFTDTDGHIFEQDIALLASLGIVTGVTAAEFAPDDPINRAQMASIIVRMFERGFLTPLPAGSSRFDDVAATNVHGQAINALAAAELASGTSATTYAPRDPVVRGQMAAFLMRATSRLVAQGELAPPETLPADDDAYHSRTRAAWVHLFDDTLKTRAGIRRLVEELALADANTIIAQVARRHDSYYTSEVLPRTTDPALSDDMDVLLELLAAAHEYDMDVHAWISVAPTTHEFYDELPAPPGWLATDHGSQAPVADRWVTRTADGSWSDYLDPGVPAVHDHVAVIVGELAARYPVAGIHLDYVRYQSENHGYNPTALDRFRAETGRTDTPAPTDTEWSQWRRDQTEALIRRAGEAIDAAGGDIEISAPVITWAEGPTTLDRSGFRGTLAYTRALQDWDRWVRRGLVDAVYPMNYFRSHDAAQARQFARWLDYEQELARASDARIVPGPAGYLNQPPAAYDQIAAAMRHGDGASVYSYHQPTLDGSRDLWARLGRTRWAYPPTG